MNNVRATSQFKFAVLHLMEAEPNMAGRTGARIGLLHFCGDCAEQLHDVKSHLYSAKF
jgi:hypothetical protein